MVGLFVLALAVSCAHSQVLTPKPIPGTETYVEPQILLGQNPGDVLWAVPVNSPLRARPVAPAPAPPAAKPVIPGTEKYVEPQILLGQAEGDVLWAVPVNSPLRANPRPLPQLVYTVEAAKALHNSRLNDPFWAMTNPIKKWEATYAGPVIQAPAAQAAAV